MLLTVSLLIWQMPIKWMALECIHYRKFTHQSDVWSYGKRWNVVKEDKNIYMICRIIEKTENNYNINIENPPLEAKAAKTLLLL